MTHPDINGEDSFYAAVAPRGTPTDFQWCTEFIYREPLPTNSGHRLACLPKGRYCTLDFTNFEFKVLTKAEFETHIEMGSLPYRDSEDFALFMGTTEYDAYAKQQTDYELQHEFYEPKQR